VIYTYGNGNSKRHPQVSRFALLNIGFDHKKTIAYLK